MPPEPTREDRYPGGRPFGDTDLDRRLFFGREAESEELTNQIVSSSLLVLFGKSGMGKTSLLQAGVFPRLRQQQLMPFMIRLNQPDQPLMEDFLCDIDEQCRAQSLDHTPGERGSLWEYFKTSAFWFNGELQTPVLVIDQAEEIFTLRPADSRRQLAEELGQLLRSGLPAAVRARAERGEQIPYTDKPPALKVILSLREDYLGHLEELASDLPQILERRFRLLSLDREAARRSVIEPALLPQGELFKTPAFQYSDAAVDEILDFLIGKDRQIEPFQLQVLCHHLEQKIGTPAMHGSAEVQPGLLGGRAGMQAILRQFYRSAIDTVSVGRQRRHARTLCEDGLLDDAGRRRSLEEDHIRRTFGVSDRTLAALVDSRVLRKEPRLDSFYYEISHDSLSGPILSSRRWSMPRRFRRRLVVVALGSAATVLLFVGIGAAYLDAVRRNRQLTERAISSVLEPLRELYNDRSKHDLLRTVSSKIIGAYEEIDEIALESATPDGFNNRGLAFDTRGTVNENQGDLAAALRDYENASIQFAAAAAAEPEVLYLNNAAIAESHRASLERTMGLGAALEHYRSALDFSERALLITDDAQRAQVRYYLSYTQLQIAEELHDRGDFHDAAASLQAAITALDELNGLAGDPVPGWRTTRVWAYIESGRQETERGRHAAALSAYHDAENAAGSQIEATGNDKGSRQDVVAVEDRMADIHLLLGDYQRSAQLSLDNRDSQLTLLNEYESKFQSDPSIPIIRRNMAAALFRHAAVISNGVGTLNALQAAAPRGAIDLGGPARDALNLAADEYEKSHLDDAGRVDAMPEDASAKLDLVSTHSALADVLTATGRFDAAVEHYHGAQSMVQSLQTIDPSNRNYRYLGSELAVGLSRAMLAKDGACEAQALSDALALQQELVKYQPEHAVWRTTLANLHETLGDCSLARNDVARAVASYEEAHKIRAFLTQLSPMQRGWRLDQAVTDYKLALARARGASEHASHVVVSADTLAQLHKLDDPKILSPVGQAVARAVLTL
jgi:tetratricopeptide (TPR) repeat protein